MSFIRYESSNCIATITIDRADKRNALTASMLGDLSAAWARFEAGEDRVAVLTGAGPSFSAGMDVSEPPVGAWMGMPNIGCPVSKPVIAAMSGACIGGAMLFAMMVDLIIADETTRFVYPEGRIGQTGGVMAGMVSRLPYKIAMELMLVGDQLDARRAFEVGLVNRVVPTGQHLQVALEYAQRIAQNAPMVMRTLKQLALATLPKGPAEQLYPDLRMLERVRDSADAAEGLAAMQQKRSPVFTNK
jgi:enoyl-CoA hydratase